MRKGDTPVKTNQSINFSMFTSVARKVTASMDRVALGLALAALLAGTASAEMLGLASSYNSYTITRAESVVQVPAQTSSAIQIGDRVSSSDARVKLETLSGQTVGLGENSEATVGADALELHRGEVAMSLTGNAKDVRTVSFGTLKIVVANGAAEGANLVAVKATSENELQVSSQGRDVEVLDADGKTVGTVKSRQVVVLSRKDKNSPWATASEQVGTVENASTTEENDARYIGGGSLGAALTGSKDAKDLGNGTFKLGKDATRKEAPSKKDSLFTTNGSESQQKRKPGTQI